MKNAVHKPDTSFPSITWLWMLPEQQKTKIQTKIPPKPKLTNQYLNIYAKRANTITAK